MPETQDLGYLSIGEVLGLLLEEFPDVTISKIRFLESQGLIAPERTASGYRKFFEPDVELLRVILREQRENYLPLRVIKDRIKTGEIDASGEMPRPDDDPANGSVGSSNASATSALIAGAAAVPRNDDHTGDIEVPQSRVAAHPAARGSARSDTTTTTTSAPSAAPQLLPGVVLDRGELCAMTGITDDELSQLESYGIVAGRSSGGSIVFGDDALELAKVSVEFLRLGVDARHLRGWRTAADREASLYEQLITPRLRQRNPEARADAVELLRNLDGLGGKLRTAMIRDALRHHFES